MRQPAKLLIVDDDPISRRVLAKLLEVEGYEIQCLDGGEAALQTVDEAPPDALLVDALMPGMDGFELCRRLRRTANGQHLPIILVTALDGPEDLVRGFDSGADEFLSKPASGPELRARVRTMLRIKSQVDQLQSALRLREDLTHSVLHDMAGPMTAMQIQIDLLLRRVTDPEMCQDLLDLQRHTQRLNAFKDDILILARMQSGKLMLARTPVDIASLAREVSQYQQTAAAARSISIRTDLPDSPCPIAVDAKLVRRAIENLLSNALKFSPQGTVIEVKVDRPGLLHGAGDGVRIEVRDQGCGVPEQDRRRIFGKFETSRVEGVGNVLQTGIGLSFCKMVVEAHRGTISVAPNHPQGSIFTMEIFDLDSMKPKFIPAETMTKKRTARL